MSDDPIEVVRYRENVGRDPGLLPEDHPFRWQWDYRGTKKEREELPALLGWMEEEPSEIIDGQEEMF